MTLTIKTDLQDTSWLRYILDQFTKINLANFQINITSLDDSHSYPNKLYYCRKYKKGQLSIFNSSEVIPNGYIEHLDNALFILENTKNELFDIGYDIFWNAFVFLSRYEEYLSEKNDKNVYSYSSRHPRVDKTSFDTPIVNLLFNKFEEFLKRNFSSLDFGEAQEPTLDLSHDVDYIDKTIQLRLKQTAFNSFNTIKSITKPKKFFENLGKTLRFAFSNPSYWCFDYWQNLEQKYNKTSTLYIYVKNGSKNFKLWLIDPSYDVKINSELQKKLKELYEDGFKIGLHGSYESAKDFQKLKEEKDILEKILDIQITKTRQHWLNYFEAITPKSHNELFEFDSTLGWNDRIGFRSGCASLYHPYDFESKKAYKFKAIPQVIMDSNLYDYADDEEIFQSAKGLLQQAKDVSKTMHISISWHQRVCSSDYGWYKFYEEVLIGE